MRKTGYLLAAAFVVSGTLAGCTKKSENPLSPTVAGPDRRRLNHRPEAARATAPADADGRHRGHAPLRERDDHGRAAHHAGAPGRARSRVHPARALGRQTAARAGRPHRLHAARSPGRPRLLLARAGRRRRQRRSVLAGLAFPDRALGPHRDAGAALAGTARRHHRRAPHAGGAEHRRHRRDQRDLPVRGRGGSGVHAAHRRLEHAAQRRRPHRGHRLRPRPGHRVLLARQRQRRRVHGALLHHPGVPDRSAARAGPDPASAAPA